MLKISITHGYIQRWVIVKGRAVGAWTTELGMLCEKKNTDLPGRKLVIDAKHLTAINHLWFEFMQSGLDFDAVVRRQGAYATREDLIKCGFGLGLDGKPRFRERPMQ